MYLHLGQSVVVPYRDVIGLFDMDNTTSSHLTRRFLERSEKEGRLEMVGDDIPKAFVLCGRQGEKTRIYLSQLSTATLKGRAEDNQFTLD
ncbi:extracellular matrix regulator RemB [Lawsonibacter faecis]|uniref:DUF370 domain-containing protein n=1 Tax=Lawsonibacter faecis TaxID=2763052 RepID=A0A8J6MGC6_9FIRM|nr:MULTISPECIES: DUF370 domain-containing protein [Oscillospiraceae]KAB4602977.1 DUF370 domain-containing protein [Bacteroides thetaiotaomicron]MTQ97680.1 DUF370 domain-containing protein [Pseudoflavonifractor sp. BIOML-A16]MTR07384.1 DUF370 domain-containing protein [Pseudoflavonifractor sp. BIOML-A15]MTR33053.1 DUF370 domain-containing protein [Pseudoflavonifractor sp. BIOML-A14]MTR74380.1 DUF370 domain-containing protein [Pseudoflavonifractor sp. BIOML-A18]MTS65503.1 DUF370 domain-containi